mgnify:CR=1 FL=1
MDCVDRSMEHLDIVQINLLLQHQVCVHHDLWHNLFLYHEHDEWPTHGYVKAQTDEQDQINVLQPNNIVVMRQLMDLKYVKRMEIYDVHEISFVVSVIPV